MRKCKFLTVILSCMVFFCSFTACKPNTLQLNFMSFNVLYTSYADTDQKVWADRKDSVIGLINDSGADIIALQEVSTKLNQKDDIQANLASKYEMIYTEDSVKMAMIYNTRVFNLVSQELYWLSDTPDEKSLSWDGSTYRGATVFVFEHKATGEKVKAINTHGSLNADANVKGFELIADRSISDDTFTVMLGDFNAEPDELGYVPIAEKLQDCMVAAVESPIRYHNTYNGFGYYSDADLNERIIDHIFVTKADTVEVSNYKVITDKRSNGWYISDHYPIRATVKIDNAKD